MVKDKSKGKPSEDEAVGNIEQDPAEFEEFISGDPGTANMSEDGAPAADSASQELSERENNEWHDKYLRLSAEFDNYRKRTLKEKADLVSTGGEDIIKAILPVIDDFDRAVEAVEKSDDIESARTGVRLIRQKLVDTLRQKGVSEVEAMGKELDTDLHEAVARFPSEDKKGKIIDVVQKGYKLKDKIIRFSKVVVGE